MPRRIRLVPLLLSIAVAIAIAGCGGEEEPSEVPKSPPPGKGLPKLADVRDVTVGRSDVFPP